MFTFVYKKRPLRIYEDYEFEGDGRRKKRHRVKIKKGNKTRFVKINIDDYKKIGKIKKVKVNKAFAKDNASQFQPIITGNKIRDLQLSSLMNSGNTTNTVYQVTKDIENKLNQQTQNIDKELKLIQDKINKGEVLDIKDLLVDDFAQDIYKEVLNKYPNDEKEANKEFLNIYKKQLVNFKDDLKIKEDEAKKLEEDLNKNKYELDKNKKELSIKKVQNFITSIIKDKRLKQQEQNLVIQKDEINKLGYTLKQQQKSFLKQELDFNYEKLNTYKDYMNLLIKIEELFPTRIQLYRERDQTAEKNIRPLNSLKKTFPDIDFGIAPNLTDTVKPLLDKKISDIMGSDRYTILKNFFSIDKKQIPQEQIKKEEQKKEEPKPKKEDKQSTPKKKNRFVKTTTTNNTATRITTTKNTATRITTTNNRRTRKRNKTRKRLKS